MSTSPRKVGVEMSERPAEGLFGALRRSLTTGRGRRLLPWMVGALVLGVLFAVLDVGHLGGVLRTFPIDVVPGVVALSAAYYLLQGVRWHLLLRDSGVPIRLRDTQLLNIAGQATGLLPLGELTRAALVSEVFAVPFGTTVATVTVQELLHTLVIVVVALPGAVHHPVALPVLLLALVLSVAVLLVLSVPAIFRVALSVVRHTPLLKRLGDQAQTLHEETGRLLRRPGTWIWTSLSVAAVLCVITMFWLIVRQLDATLLSWSDAAFVFGIASLAGMASLAPGGLGGFEVGTIGLLRLLGAWYPTAVAAALLQRAADKGLATVAGLVAVGVARRRYPVLLDRSLRGITDRERATLEHRADEPSA